MSANTGTINPAYFGYVPVHQTYDLTSMVDQIEGVRRNLPQLQFRIKTPLGYRDFIAESPAQGIDGVDPASGTAQGQTVFGPNSPRLLSTANSAANANANTLASISLVWFPGMLNTNAVEEYVIQRATVISGPYSNVGNTGGANTRFTDNTISTGTVYYYDVVAVDSANLVSGPSNILSNTVASPPPLPADFLSVSFSRNIANTSNVVDLAVYTTSFGKVAYSNSVVSYNTYTSTGAATGNLWGSAISNSTVIVVGDNGQIYRAIASGSAGSAQYINPASWTQESACTSATFYAVAIDHFGSGATVAVGYDQNSHQGVIAVNTGSGWSTQFTGINVALRGVDFCQANCFIGGDGGTILHSGPPYTSWVIPGFGNHTINGVCSDDGYVQGDAGVIIMVGANGTIYRSNNNPSPPLTWTTIPSGTTANLYSVTTSLTNDNNWVAVGEGGIILNSFDRGLSWINFGLSVTTNNLRGVATSLYSAEFLTAGIDQTILKSTDGINWSTG